MKEYTNNDPVFSEKFMMIEPTDPGHADNFNKGTKQIFQNTLYNHKLVDELKKGIIPDGAYNPDISYVPGDYCSHDSMLYRCIQNTTGEWDASCWQQTSTFEEIHKLEYPDFDDSGEIEGIESFVDFMSSFVTGTKQDQFLANLKAGLKYVLHAGQLVNSGLCETPGMFPLDAAYGKTLTDQITGLYSEIIKSSINESMRYKINIYHNWGIDVTAGAISKIKFNVPDGYVLAGLFLTPQTSRHITMSYIDDYIYAYSEDYTGILYYDALMILWK